MGLRKSAEDKLNSCLPKSLASQEKFAALKDSDAEFSAAVNTYEAMDKLLYDMSKAFYIMQGETAQKQYRLF